jgi:hypothetical protein
VLQQFASLQREYGSMMAVVQAVLHDLQQDDADETLISAVEKILVNESAIVFQPVDKGDGKKKKSAVRSKGQEALRAAAEQLTGKLAERATTKAADKAGTQAMRDAVQKQKPALGACYRILAAVAH